MPEKINIQVSGKSKYEIAHEMAIQILLNVEKKSWGDFNRIDYLQAHRDALRILDGGYPGEA